MKRTPVFTALVDQIWSLIEEEVRASMDVRNLDDGSAGAAGTTNQPDPAGLQDSGTPR